MIFKTTFLLTLRNLVINWLTVFSIIKIDDIVLKIHKKTLYFGAIATNHETVLLQYLDKPF